MRKLKPVGPSWYEGLIVDNRFVLEHRLGAGGMGEVWQARNVDPDIDTRVALKFLDVPLDRRPEIVQRWKREFNALQAVSSDPNIVTVHYLGKHEGIPYIQMELIEGETLADKVERHSIVPHTLGGLRLSAQVASGLAAMHEKGLVMRDLKPSNVMVTDAGIVKLIDFGIVKDLAQKGITKEHELNLSIGWAPPERILRPGAEATPEGDVYTLGLVMLGMFNYWNPLKDPKKPRHVLGALNYFASKWTVPEILAKHGDEVKDIVHSCLERSPRKRPTAAYVRESCDSLIGGMEMGAATMRFDRKPSLTTLERVVESASVVENPTDGKAHEAARRAFEMKFGPAVLVRYDVFHRQLVQSGSYDRGLAGKTSSDSRLPLYFTTEKTFTEDSMVVGRGQKADVRMAHDGISRAHAYLTQECGRLYIRDESSNGTSLDGKKIPSRQRMPIEPEMQIDFGPSAVYVAVTYDSLAWRSQKRQLGVEFNYVTPTVSVDTDPTPGDEYPTEKILFEKPGTTKRNVYKEKSG